MVGTSKDGCITVETESWLELQETGIYHSRNRIMVGTSKDGLQRDGCITVETESWLELQGYITVETESWLELQGTGIYHSRNRIMVGTSRDRMVYQGTGIYHSRNRIMVGTSREQGYITVETESWLELQETGIYQETVQTESWLELQETGIYHSRNRIMVGTSRDSDISQ